MNSYAVRANSRLDAVSKLDPRGRIIVVVAFAILVVSLKSFEALGLAIGFSISCLLFSNQPFGRTVRRMASVDGFIVLVLVMLPFTTPGEEWFTLFGFVATWEGLWRACQIALVANAIVLAILSLVGSMQTVTFGQALHRLKVPESFVQLLLFTVRYIDVLTEEYQRSRMAMKARGFRPSNSFHCYRTYGFLVGMMLVKAMERSERVLNAMKCRGFSGRWPHFDQMSWKGHDFVFAVLVVLVLALLLWVDGL